MGINRSNGPQAGPSAVGQALTDLRASGAPANALRTLIQPTMTQPIQLFGLRLDEVNGEDFPDHAQPLGWRYLIAGDKPVAVADIKGVGESVSFDKLIHGRVAERFFQAAQFANNVFGSSPDEYELRILEIPAIYLAALWLKGPRDIFITFLDESQTDTTIRIDDSFVDRVLRLVETKRRLPRNDPDRSN